METGRSVVSEEEFLSEPMIRTVRRAVEDDIGGRATPSQVRLLYDNPLLWLRVLRRISKEIENHIAKDRRSLVELRPPAGSHASDEYLKAKNEVDERAKRRLHFKQIVDSRVEDAKCMISPDAVGTYMIGDLVDAFLAIAEDVQYEDLRSIDNRARYWAKKLSELDLTDD